MLKSGVLTTEVTITLDSAAASQWLSDITACYICFIVTKY